MFNKALLVCHADNADVFDFWFNRENGWYYGDIQYPTELNLWLQVSTQSWDYLYNFSTTVTTDDRGYFSVEFPGLSDVIPDGYRYTLDVSWAEDTSQNMRFEWEGEFPFKDGVITEVWVNDHS